MKAPKAGKVVSHERRAARWKWSKMISQIPGLDMPNVTNWTASEAFWVWLCCLGSNAQCLIGGLLNENLSKVEPTVTAVFLQEVFFVQSGIITCLTPWWEILPPLES